MNVTDSRFKNRQLHMEDYLQMVSAEQKEYAGVFDYSKITEKSGVITDYWTNNLLELILRKENLNQAYKRVKSNKGACGIDGMQVDELLAYLKENQEDLIQKIRGGRYKPNPVRRVEIPKEIKGEYRKLGIPTVVDRVIQQAITQELSPIYEEQFSESSFGFRPKRGAHDALRQCQKNVHDGYVYVVDMDLEKFFDTVCQSKLMEVMSRTIRDSRVISLIHKYLNAGVIANGVFERTETGMPQEGPLSPLLSNIMLNELDKEVESRGHRFVRYADDCMIFCKSKKSAGRTLRNIIPFIEEKLFLKVNRRKTKVSHISKVKYLGYGFYIYKGKCRLRVHPKTVEMMKDKIRILTDRNSGMSNAEREEKYQQYVRGWVNYFKLADMKELLRKADEWARRRIRAVYWKQWKKIKTKYRMLSKGVRWKDKGYRVDGISFDMFYRAEGFDVAANLYPQYKKKKNEYGEIVNRTTTKSSDERTMKISEVILQSIQDKGYCTEREVIYILGNDFKYEVTETQIKRSLNEIMVYGK